MDVPQFILKAIEGGWRVGVVLIVISGGIFALHHFGLPEPNIFREWLGWASLGFLCGIGIVIVSAVAGLSSWVRQGASSRKSRREMAEAEAQAASEEVEFIKRNFATLDDEERELLIIALRQHPSHLQVFGHGPGQALVNKRMLQIVGRGSGAFDWICTLHPLLAEHRSELLGAVSSHGRR